MSRAISGIRSAYRVGSAEGIGNSIAVAVDEVHPYWESHIGESWDTLDFTRGTTEDESEGAEEDTKLTDACQLVMHVFVGVQHMSGYLSIIYLHTLKC